MNEAPLNRYLQRLIATHGPISMAQYMAEVLGHPEHGYYITREPFGPDGDFVTAPEVSQMFGELIGAWCADIWRQMGTPSTVRMVELGPGRGTLMSDALRATKGVPGFHEAVDLHLVETSARLRDLQAAALQGFAPTWHDQFSEVPPGPLLFIANELFDALPVHQFVVADGTWRERLIGLNDDGELAFTIGPALDGTPTRSPDPVAPAGTIRETCPIGTALARELGAFVAEQTGAGLIVDYGYSAPGFGDTVQAVQGHETHAVLSDPGMADLCAHVNFAALGDAARDGGAFVHGPVTQGEFLNRLGLRERAAALAAAAPSEASEIRTAAARLTDKSQMGSLFKVLALSSAGIAPAGFDA